MKSFITIFAIILKLSITNAQDILLIKKNGGVMEGYFQKFTPENVIVKFGESISEIELKSVEIIYGENYLKLKKKGAFKYLHEINPTSKQIRRAIKSSLKEINKKKIH
ncbi:MAG: hypothetical protein IPO78_04530 [Saprospiraceae bacterium]|nr:hypothetical protein [Saprospiraceae bacterium]MBK9720867.1 hypothetical protein [Saprospiraceae bacterium]